MGVTRFDDFRERLGISRNVLNQRLSHLVDDGVLERVAYCEHPPRLRLPADGQGQGPVAGAHHHAAMGRPLGSPRWAAHRDRPQGLRPRHRGRSPPARRAGRSRVRARRFGRCRPRGDRGSTAARAVNASWNGRLTRCRSLGGATQIGEPAQWRRRRPGNPTGQARGALIPLLVTARSSPAAAGRTQPVSAAVTGRSPLPDRPPHRHRARPAVAPMGGPRP